MRSKLILLLSFALLIPTAAAAGFLGRPGARPPDAPFASSPPEFAGMPNLSGRVDLSDRAAEHVLGNAPPFGGFDPVDDAVSPSESPISATPEPSTVLLLLFGLAGIGLRRRAIA
jgi:hypothetical protein